jgi:hypothetical protein
VATTRPISPPVPASVLAAECRLLLYGTPLSGGRGGRVAVIVQPAPAADIAPLIALAYGLSERERALAALLRPGNAGSNTAADHLTVIRAALRQLPSYRAGHRPGRKILIRVDGAGATHELLDWLVGQRLYTGCHTRSGSA